VLGGGYAVDIEAQGDGLKATLAAVPGVRSVEEAAPGRLRLFTESDVRAECAAAVVNGGGRLLRISVEEPSLDAIYNRYFQGKSAHGGLRDAA
jgi:ABC-2 type transport system ATP-binding protein